MVQASRLHAVLRAKDNLPQAERNLFSLLFQERNSTEQICRNLSISPQELQRQKSQMLRTLMRAS